MDLNEVKTLIERFENGETSREEEIRLSHFFLSEKDLPGELAGYGIYFRAMEQRQIISAPQITPEMFKSSGPQPPVTAKNRLRITPFWFKSLAASVIILLAIALTLQISNPGLFYGKKKYSEEEKRKAYHQTLATLSYVGNLLNKGAEPVSYLGKYDEGIENVGKIEILTTSLNQVSEISKLNIINIDYQNK